MANWRIHKSLSFCVLGITIAALLGIGGIELSQKAFNVIEWKWLLLIGQGYLAWSFKNLLNF